MQQGAQIAVLTATASGWDTWVDSVDETTDKVVVHVRTQMRVGSGAPVAVRVWLTVTLNAPLGNRTVIDGAANTVVPLES